MEVQHSTGLRCRFAIFFFFQHVKDAAGERLPFHGATLQRAKGVFSSGVKSFREAWGRTFPDFGRFICDAIAALAVVMMHGGAPLPFEIQHGRVTDVLISSYSPKKIPFPSL